MVKYFEDFLKGLESKADKEKRKDKKAVALGYDKEQDRAPRVLATGQGTIAEKIIEMARANNIPIHEDAALVEMLGQLELNSFIPIEAYVTVAEILSYIYHKNAERRDSM